MITVTSVDINGSDVIIEAEEIGPDEHTMTIPITSIGSRMALYKLTMAESALDALIREHFVLMSEDHENPETKEAAIAQYEKLKNLPIKGCENLRKAVINDNLDIIKEAYSVRS